MTVRHFAPRLVMEASPERVVEAKRVARWVSLGYNASLPTLICARNVLDGLDIGAKYMDALDAAIIVARVETARVPPHTIEETMK